MADQNILLGAPLVILGAVWVSSGPVLTAFKMLNDQRDLVVGLTPKDEKLPAKHRKMIFWNDYVPLWVGVLVFLMLLTASVFAAAQYLSSTEVHGTFSVLCYLATLLPFATAIGFGAGGIGDIIAMRRAIAEAAEAEGETPRRIDPDRSRRAGHRKR